MPIHPNKKKRNICHFGKKGESLSLLPLLSYKQSTKTTTTTKTIDNTMKTVREKKNVTNKTYIRYDKRCETKKKERKK